MNFNYRCLKVTIVTLPLGIAGSTPLSNLVKLVSEVANEVYLISGGTALKNLEAFKNVYVLRIMHKPGFNIIGRIFSYVYTEFKILCSIISLRKVSDLFIFFIGGEILVLSMLTLKLLRKKVIMMPGGIAEKGYAVRKDPLTKLLSLLIKFNMNLADKLVIYSSLLIVEGNWNKYNSKTFIAHEHFINSIQFKMDKEIEKRKYVGYVGRLSIDKGTLNLIEAIPLILRKKIVHFIICGHGDLADVIRKLIEMKNIKNYVSLMGWVPHNNLPDYLNEMKLLVLPSYTEGLPNILLEAMACGTPVLATPVGAIPSIIKDGENGFLLKSNDPQHIADKVVDLLNQPELLKKVSISAYKYVRENFRYEKTLEIWREILEEF